MKKLSLFFLFSLGISCPTKALNKKFIPFKGDISIGSAAVGVLLGAGIGLISVAVARRRERNLAREIVITPAPTPAPTQKKISLRTTSWRKTVHTVLTLHDGHGQFKTFFENPNNFFVPCSNSKCEEFKKSPQDCFPLCDNAQCKQFQRVSVENSEKEETWDTQAIEKLVHALRLGEEYDWFPMFQKATRETVIFFLSEDEGWNFYIWPRAQTKRMLIAFPGACVLSSAGLTELSRLLENNEGFAAIFGKKMAFHGAHAAAYDLNTAGGNYEEKRGKKQQLPSHVVKIKKK